MVNREQQEPARHHLMERIGNVTSLNDLCLKGWSDEVPMYLWSAYKIEANNTREWTLGSLPYSRFLDSRVRATSISQRRRPRLKKKKQLHQPGIEPGSVPWQGTILPLDHWCRCLALIKYLNYISLSLLSLTTAELGNATCIWYHLSVSESPHSTYGCKFVLLFEGSRWYSLRSKL